MRTEPSDREPLGDPEPDGGDFATEHDDTTVDERVSSGTDEAESESPAGLGGMDKGGSGPG
jgi:hypothetical protein